ncbi:hypothetical protein H9Q10_00065 [Eikenella sp. S3360]|uniref:Factor H binding protein-like C-terminal domain-containing protein n=1 Tax=Eikenella glucosivorans TaxID=2766967 RepID=A0ABS0N712_9NEIS|nr:factor H binding protein domain-containing protein [Eikenella glucosivorans]MBH5328071.1 hypothetical protein [Eikenella glucosivorans]
MTKHLFCTTIIALGLAACGSSGGGSPSVQNNNTPTPAAQTTSPDAESSAVKNAGTSLDYRRNYAAIIGSKSVIAAQTLMGPQAGNNTRGEKNLTLTLNGRSYGLTDRINIAALPDGLLELPYKAEWTSLKVAYPSPNRDVNVEEQGKMYIYQRPYSMVLATRPDTYRYDGANDPNNRLNRQDTMKVQLVSGLPVSDATINRLSGNTFNYKGESFANFGSGLEKGVFDYNINFTDKTGSGRITGMASTGDIELRQGRIGSAQPFNPMLNSAERTKGINGTASSERMDASWYYLSIFGPNAEEVAGFVEGSRRGSSGQWNIGVSGTKQP